MKTRRMPPALRAYWEKRGHKTTKLTHRPKRRRHAGHVAHHHARKRPHCAHMASRRVVTGAPAKWCSACGGLFDGERWHRPRS